MGLTLTPVANGMNWTPYAVGGAAARPDSFTGLVPQFASGVYSMVQDAHAAGIPLQITSAYRSPDVQARLYQNALKKYGSEKAARKWVAPPGRSQHNFGTAVDFAMNGSLIRDANSPAAQWIKANAAKYGLDVPMSWEPWQVELAGARGKAPAKRVSQTVQSAQSGQNVQNRPQGIFSTQSSQQEAPQMQPQNATGLLGALFPNMTADRQDRLAMALSGLSMHPNQGVMQAAGQRMSDRRQDRKQAHAQAQQQQQANRTVEYLATTLGRPDLAQAVAQGVMSGSDAYKMATRQPEQVKGTEINGQLVNPITGDVMGDYRTPETPKISAKEAQIERTMQSQGVDRTTAQGIVDGVLRVSRDPLDDTIMVTNLATGKSYRPQMPAEPWQNPPEPQEKSGLSFGIGAGDRTDAFGLEGMFKRGANAVADTFGMGVPYGDVQTTISDFGVLKESLINDMASAYNRQPPSWLLKNIEALTPQAGTLQGAGGAKSQLEAIRRNFENELRIAEGQGSRRQSPQQQQANELKVSGLYAAIQRVDAAIQGLGGSAGANTTSSGIKWQVEQ